MKHAQYIFIFAVISSAYGQWLLQTNSRSCSSDLPYSATIMPMNCSDTGFQTYQKIDCDNNSFVNYYECYEAECSARSCKRIFTELQNQCNQYGITNICYPNSMPDYQKYFGKDYILHYRFSKPSCFGSVVDISVYQRDSCQIMSTNLSTVTTCNNNTVHMEWYRTDDCSGKPYTISSGEVGDCTDSSRWACF
jgi:hypothetical protein